MEPPIENVGKMREAITSKKIIGAAAIALFALAFVPATFASSPPTGFTLSMSGLVGNPSQGVLGTFSMSLVSITSFNRGALVQGTAGGSFTFTAVGGTPTTTPIGCGWSYDTSTGKALMKCISLDPSNQFDLNLAFLNLNTNVGFTFQGIIHINGQGPVMLSATFLSLLFS